MLTTPAALLVIDMENAFFWTETLRTLLPEQTARCNEFIIAARKAGAAVVNIQTQHERNKPRIHEVILAKDAMASYLPEMHEPTLEVLKAEHRQPALSNEEIIRNVFVPEPGG